MAIADAGETIFVPAVGTRARLFVGEVVPGVAVWAIVFADGAPRSIAQVRPPSASSRPLGGDRFRVVRVLRSADRRLDALGWMSSCRASVGSRLYFDRPCVPVWSGSECQLFRQLCVHVQGAIHVTSPYQTTRQISVALMSAALLCAAAPASAQDHQLAGLLLDLLSHAGRNAANNVQHPMHYIPGLALELAPRELNKAIASQLTTFPLPSSSGGFAFTTDPATGEVRLESRKFGPVFADRALTIGKGRFDFGVAFQPVKFDSFETAELTGSNIRFFLEHNNCCPAATTRRTSPAGEGPSQFTPDFRE